MAEEWGPWIEHDGAGISVPEGARLQIRWIGEGVPPPTGNCDLRTLPNCFWRWRRVRTGLFKSELRRVCDDPVYAPIICYRIRRPDALRRLIDLAADPDRGVPQRFPVEELV